MFYSALHHPETSGNCPSNCCWCRQIQIPLDWISAFLAQHPGDITRTFTLDAHLRRGLPIAITTDASQYGIRAVLEEGPTLVAHLSDTFVTMEWNCLTTSFGEGLHLTARKTVLTNSKNNKMDFLQSI